MSHSRLCRELLDARMGLDGVPEYYFSGSTSVPRQRRSTHSPSPPTSPRRPSSRRNSFDSDRPDVPPPTPSPRSLHVQPNTLAQSQEVQRAHIAGLLNFLNNAAPPLLSQELLEGLFTKAKDGVAPHSYLLTPHELALISDILDAEVPREKLRQRQLYAPPGEPYADPPAPGNWDELDGQQQEDIDTLLVCLNSVSKPHLSLEHLRQTYIDVRPAFAPGLDLERLSDIGQSRLDQSLRRAIATEKASSSREPPRYHHHINLLNEFNNLHHPRLSEELINEIFVQVKAEVAPDITLERLTEEGHTWLQHFLIRGVAEEKVLQSRHRARLYKSVHRSSSRAPITMAVHAWSTPTLDQFLGEISRILRERNGAQLQDYLVIEPPYSDLYNKMIDEIREAFPKGASPPELLEEKCAGALPEARDGIDGASWLAFIKFMSQYCIFIRDVDVRNLLVTYNLLSELVQKANSALSHLSMGIIILPTVISYSRVLARVAIGLDRNPSLIAHVSRQAADSDERETLAERAANIVRHAFVTCLNDRSGGLGSSNGPPTGKKVAIYTIANLCLKILFACRKPRNAEQIFANIYNLSPPLARYPASERVSYLYYLGRFHFSNNHFGRAAAALDHAYRLCPPGAVAQRRKLLVHLVAAHILLGRFPSAALYARPEAAELHGPIAPLCRAIALGDLASFRRLTALPPAGANIATWTAAHPTPAFLLRHRILLQLRNRAEVLVWRSLARRTFLLAGDRGDAASRKAATLDLHALLVVARGLELRAALPDEPAADAAPSWGAPGRRNTNWAIVEQARGGTPALSRPRTDAEAAKLLLRHCDPDLEGTSSDDDDSDSSRDPPGVPDMPEVEAIVASLVQQGLLNGYVSHARKMFAIRGAKQRGNPVAAGFPPVWDVVGAQWADTEVPGWKKEGRGGGGFGPGMVVNLTGARPVGAG